MSLVELIPGVRSLSRSDKLRLIRFLAEELAEEDDPSSVRDPEMSRNGPNVADRRAKGEQVEVGLELADSSEFDRVWERLAESSLELPVWFPDQSYEAAAILSRLLEQEKSKP